LLKRFGSVQRLRLAPVEKIAEVPGFGGKAAAELKAFLEARSLVTDPEANMPLPSKMPSHPGRRELRASAHSIHSQCIHSRTLIVSHNEAKSYA
jgi:NAD-dependent DNA ligase